MSNSDLNSSFCTVYNVLILPDYKRQNVFTLITEWSRDIDISKDFFLSSVCKLFEAVNNLSAKMTSIPVRDIDIIIGDSKKDGTTYDAIIDKFNEGTELLIADKTNQDLFYFKIVGGNLVNLDYSEINKHSSLKNLVTSDDVILIFIDDKMIHVISVVISLMHCV